MPPKGAPGKKKPAKSTEQKEAEKARDRIPETYIYIYIRERGRREDEGGRLYLYICVYVQEFEISGPGKGETCSERTRRARKPAVEDEDLRELQRVIIS